MIGIGIGLGIGGGYIFGNVEVSLPAQSVNLSGFVKVSGTSVPTSRKYSMNARLVAGNDVLLRLKVYDAAGGAFDLSQIASVVYGLDDQSGLEIINREYFSDFIQDGHIVVTLTESDTDGLSGQYPHEFLLILSDGSTCTVLADCDLEPGTFTFRAPVATAI